MAGKMLDGKELTAREKKTLLSLASTRPEQSPEDPEGTLHGNQEFRRRLIDDLIDRHGILGDVLVGNGHRALAGERRLATEQFVENHTE